MNATLVPGAASALFLLLGATMVRGGDRDLPIVERQPEERLSLAFPDPSAPGVVDVDNVWGDVTVEAADIDNVEVVASRTVHARDREAVAAAGREVRLTPVTEPYQNLVRVVVDGPFRCNDNDDDGDGGGWAPSRRYALGRRSCRGRWFEPDYEVHYRLLVRVPRHADVIASTVNDGDVVARRLGGRFEVRNVNGDVTVEDATGGKAAGVHTVNGELHASFLANPTADCRFSNVNGDVDLTFASGLSADVSIETMNGEALSDFPYTALPQAMSRGRQQDGRFVYRSSSPTIRIGGGGPTFATETLNGDILLRRRSP